MNLTMTKNTTYIINDMPYTILLRDVQLREFKAKHKHLNSKQLRVAFLKEEINNQIYDIEMNDQAEANLQILINRLEMVDLMYEAGVDIETIEDSTNDLITTEEIQYYKNFQLTPRGFFTDINIRR